MGAKTDAPPAGRPPLIDVAEGLAAGAPVSAMSAGELAELTREQLDERAREAGVVEPEKLPNKAAVTDAIEAASNPPSGEGMTPNPED